MRSWSRLGRYDRRPPRSHHARQLRRRLPHPSPRRSRPSLSKVDAEAQGAAKKPAPAEAEIDEEEEVKMDESLDDGDTFIEEQEDEDPDVTDIIGGDIENKEEG